MLLSAANQNGIQSDADTVIHIAEMRAVGYGLVGSVDALRKPAAGFAKNPPVSDVAVHQHHTLLVS